MPKATTSTLDKAAAAAAAAQATANALASKNVNVETKKKPTGATPKTNQRWVEYQVNDEASEEAQAEADY